MNREILFRGFHECEDGTTTIIVDGKKVKGDWAYGNLCIEEKHTFITFNYINALGNFGTRYMPVISVIVIEKTVGQYTGLTDKNCKKVFEGDICRLLTRDCGEERKYAICYGEFCDCNSEDDFIGFYISGEIDSENIKCSILQDSVICNSEVIGNIYDNPELFEEKK